MKKTILILLVIAAISGICIYGVYASAGKATIVNSSGEKKIITVGSHIPLGWKIYVESKLGASPVNSFFSASSSAVTTTAGKGIQVLQPNAGRHYAMITNTTATIAYLSLNSTTTPNGTVGVTDASYTIPLAASGGYYVINLDNLYTGGVLASSSAAVTIRVLDAN